MYLLKCDSEMDRFGKSDLSSTERPSINTRAHRVYRNNVRRRARNWRSRIMCVCVTSLARPMRTPSTVTCGWHLGCVHVHGTFICEYGLDNARSLRVPARVPSTFRKTWHDLVLVAVTVKCTGAARAFARWVAKSFNPLRACAEHAHKSLQMRARTWPTRWSAKYYGTSPGTHTFVYTYILYCICARAIQNCVCVCTSDALFGGALTEIAHRFASGARCVCWRSRRTRAAMCESFGQLSFNRAPPPSPFPPPSFGPSAVCVCVCVL